MNELLDILTEINPLINYGMEKHLMTNRLFDSLSVLSLVSELCDVYDIEIGPKWIHSENFESVETIWRMLQRIQEEQ